MAQANVHREMNVALVSSSFQDETVFAWQPAIPWLANFRLFHGPCAGNG